VERETVLLVAAAAVCGPLACAMGFVPSLRRLPDSGRAAEALAWRRLWLSLVPAALALGVLVGWAMQEPDPTDERFRLALVVAAVPWVPVWARAALRAVRSLRSRERPLAATVGLLLPTVHVAPELAQALDAAALAAAREHEAAHARHRDPLRLWLGQLAADLQWPWPQAARRFADWRHALELARDEEARVRGVDGADLAHAILAAARTDSRWGPTAVALTGDAARLRDRIHRLLEPLPESERTSSWPARSMLVLALLGAAVAVGVLRGEALVRWIPGIGP
jgi:hypothetical protein